MSGLNGTPCSTNAINTSVVAVMPQKTIFLILFSCHKMQGDYFFAVVRVRKEMTMSDIKLWGIIQIYDDEKFAKKEIL